MGLCAHCKTQDIAWHHDGKVWVAYCAAVDGTGALARQLVDAGKGRMVRRTVPDLARRHYPHADRTGGPKTADECPAWTLQAAREAKRKGKGVGSGGAAPTQ